MKNYIVNELIAAMKERIPRGINLVTTWQMPYVWEKRLYTEDYEAKWLSPLTKLPWFHANWEYQLIRLLKSPVEPCDFRFKPASLTRSSGKLLWDYRTLSAHIQLRKRWYQHEDIYRFERNSFHPLFFVRILIKVSPVQMDLSKWENTYPKQLIGNAHTGQSGPCP